MVYASGSELLAQRETARSLGPAKPPSDYVCCCIQIPAEVSRSILTELPADWRHNEAETAQIGSRWLRLETSALLIVPSVLVSDPESVFDMNVLINPQHRDASLLSISATETPRWSDEILTRRPPRR